MSTDDTPILAATKAVLQMAKQYIGSGEDVSPELIRSANAARKEIKRAEELKSNTPRS
jgi:hypothetical protein